MCVRRSGGAGFSVGLGGAPACPFVIVIGPCLPS
jgi:hypothetical protein